jgi:hypothetical protein
MARAALNAEDATIPPIKTRRSIEAPPNLFFHLNGNYATIKANRSLGEFQDGSQDRSHLAGFRIGCSRLGFIDSGTAAS